MRPVVVTAVLLLVLLMFISDSAADYPADMCMASYPDTPCMKNIGEGWVQFGTKRCVKAFYNTEHLGHSEAEMACRKYPYGHLVSIHSHDDLNGVQCAMYRATPGKAHYWIGYFVSSNGEYRKWAWTDDSRDDYSRWAGGQPDFFLRRELCVEMNYWDWGLWNDEACWQQRPYVCQVRVQ